MPRLLIPHGTEKPPNEFRERERGEAKEKMLSARTLKIESSFPGTGIAYIITEEIVQRTARETEAEIRGEAKGGVFG